jgi:glycine/D-amino acid oxidase-like deaminating enzyme
MSESAVTDRNFDVLVVGGGMVGTSTALFSAERGLSVALIDAAKLGLGTSNNSFAWINATSKTTDDDYHRLNALGAAGYRALCAQWGEERVGVHPTGMLQWAAPSDDVTRNALEARYQRLCVLGYPAALVGFDDLTAMEPHVRFAEGAIGLHALADAWLDVPTFIAFAAERIRELGGTVLTETPAEALILDEQGGIQGVQTPHGAVSGRQVVIAGGPSTASVLAAVTGYSPFESRFPMSQAPGLLVRTPPVSPYRLARHILYCGEANAVHVRPTPDGGLLLGADDTDGAASFPDDQAGLRAAATALLDRAHSLMPRFPGPSLLDECELKIGVRPMPADGHSIAGPMPGSPGLFVACTHSGVTLSPAIGSLLAEEIATGKRPKALARFGFERFQSV